MFALRCSFEQQWYTVAHSGTQRHTAAHAPRRSGLRVSNRTKGFDEVAKSGLCCANFIISGTFARSNASDGITKFALDVQTKSGSAREWPSDSSLAQLKTAFNAAQRSHLLLNGGQQRASLFFRHNRHDQPNVIRTVTGRIYNLICVACSAATLLALPRFALLSGSSGARAGEPVNRDPAHRTPQRPSREFQ